MTEYEGGGVTGRLVMQGAITSVSVSQLEIAQGNNPLGLGLISIGVLKPNGATLVNGWAVGDAVEVRVTNRSLAVEDHVVNIPHEQKEAIRREGELEALLGLEKTLRDLRARKGEAPSVFDAFERMMQEHLDEKKQALFRSQEYAAESFRKRRALVHLKPDDS